MARVAVVKADTVFEGQQLKAGERFRIVDDIQEPSDFFIMMEVDTVNYIPVDLGDGYAVMTKTAGADGTSFDTFFTEEEA